MSLNKDILERIHEETALHLLRRVQTGEASAQELGVVVKFLKDNGATYDIITKESPLGNLLENLPFDIS
jgi:hypothetical protein